MRNAFPAILPTSEVTISIYMITQEVYLFGGLNKREVSFSVMWKHRAGEGLQNVHVYRLQAANCSPHQGTALSS